jgi:cobalt-zinc-cadmium efflux system outer membrane protein
MTKRMTIAATTAATTAGCLLLASLAVAQPPQPPIEIGPLADQYLDARGGLALTDALAQALEHEPSLRVSRAEVDAARGLRAQATRRPNPTVSLERRDEPAGTDTQTMVTIQWPLDLFRRTPRIEVRDREVEASTQTLADRQRTLLADVRAHYGQAAAAVREVAVSEQVAIATRRQYEVLAQRVVEGAAPPLDRDVVDVELRRVDAERLLAAGRADAALFELRRVIGMSAETAFALRDTLETLVATDVLADAGQQETAALSAQAPLTAQRADVLEAGARVRVAEARVDQARSAGRLDVSVFGGYMRMDTGYPQRGLTDQGTFERVRGQFQYVSAGAMVLIPLSDRHQGEVVAAQAERTAAVARLEGTQLSAQSEIAADRRTRQALALIERSVDLSRKNLGVVRQTYELGQSTVSDVLVAQRRYLEVERTYTDTLRAAFDARTALRRARGDGQ